ncbi:MAG: cytidine deaminase [Spirochaetales bacterium]|jgi:cytidine deaminase|nr:cytidine deaminase [Spirochaetales bacterium]
MSAEQIELLVNTAKKAAAAAYAPYSNFRVGAALLCADGTIISGFNIENRSYSLTICAERCAIAGALSTGKKEFSAIAVFGLDSIEPLPPCGACRQVLSEFLPEDAPVHFSGTSGRICSVPLNELLPHDSLHRQKSTIS